MAAGRWNISKLNSRGEKDLTSISTRIWHFNTVFESTKERSLILGKIGYPPNFCLTCLSLKRILSVFRLLKRMMAICVLGRLIQPKNAKGRPTFFIKIFFCTVGKKASWEETGKDGSKKKGMDSSRETL